MFLSKPEVSGEVGAHQVSGSVLRAAEQWVTPQFAGKATEAQGKEVTSPQWFG